MEELINRLKGRGKEPAPRAASAIFGSFGSPGRVLMSTGPRLKIGLWPIQSVMPEAAMGIAALLGYLLERWPNIRVYRLFARLEGEPQTYQWTVNQSQFSVDDWELDGLDENVAIWGAMSKTDAGWKLTLEVENDLADEGDDLRTFSHEAGQPGELIAWLPQAADQIADYLDAGDVYHPAYSTVPELIEADIERLLADLFHWELNLFLSLWGREWPSEQINSDLDRLFNHGAALKDVGAWAVVNAFGRALSPVFDPVGEALVPRVPDIYERYKQYEFAAAFIAFPLHQFDYRDEAYGLLEENINQHPESVSAYLRLADLYGRGGELAAVVDVYQRAIESDVVSAELFRRYAELLLLLDTNNIAYGVGARQHTLAGRSFVEGFVLIDPEEVESDWLRWEAVEAYREALDLEPDDLETHQHLAIQLAELGDEEVWDALAELVKRDTAGERARGVVDALYGIEDVSPAVDIFRDAARKNPDQVMLKFNLAAVYLMNDEPDAARAELEAAAAMTDNPQWRSEIDRLMLSVDDPGFEARFGEISDLVGAGAQLNAADVEFLENALEDAPNFAECYTLLASAYVAWNEHDDALEVLLDGQRRFPDNPDILTLLGRVLWNGGEKELAFDYLNKGLAQNPNHVPLLVTTAQYLFDNDQDETARTLLLRAEALDPRHPMLNTVRAYIARAVKTE